MRSATFRFDARPWTMNSERAAAHWSMNRARVAEWRRAFWVLGLEQRVRFEKVRIEVDIAMRAPLADTGNSYGAVKAAIDGLVDARVLPDDNPRIVRELVFRAPVRALRDDPEFLALTLTELDS